MAETAETEHINTFIENCAFLWFEGILLFTLEACRAATVRACGVPNWI